MADADMDTLLTSPEEITLYADVLRMDRTYVERVAGLVESGYSFKVATEIGRKELFWARGVALDHVVRAYLERVRSAPRG